MPAATALCHVRTSLMRFDPGVPRMYVRALACISAVFAAIPTSAAMVTFRFDGVVNSNSITGGDWSFTKVGDSFAVEYTFDSDSPDSNPLDGLGDFNDCITDFALFAGTAFETGYGGNVYLTNAVTGDDYQISLNLMSAFFAIHLSDATGTALSSDAQVTDLTLDPWTGRVFTISTSDNAQAIVGTITSFTLVPAPATIGILAPAAFCLSRRRR